VKAEPNVSLYLSTRGIAVEMSGSKIAAVIGRTSRPRRDALCCAARARQHGDGAIGALAGAEFRYGRESSAETGESGQPEKADTQTMGSSVQWYSREAKEPVAFPDIQWGLAFNDTTASASRWASGPGRPE
jgi:hypothetical protein